MNRSRLRAKLAENLQGADKEDWEKLSPCIEYTPEVLSAIHETVTPVFYATLYQEGQPVAAATLSFKRLDLLTLSGYAQARSVQALRSLNRRAFTVPTIVVGLPVSWGSRAYLSASSISIVEVIRALRRVAFELCDSLGASLVLFKELYDEDVAALGVIEEDRFFVGPTPETFSISLPGKSFDSYLGAMRSGYRQDVVRSLRKFSKADASCQRFFGKEAAAAYSRETHELVRSVYDRSTTRFESEPQHEYFTKLASRLGAKMSLTTLEDQSGLLACSWAIIGDLDYRLINCGVNYEQNRRVDSYFNIFYEEIRNAYSSDLCRVNLGQTSSSFKSRIGGIPANRFVALSPKTPIFRWGLRHGQKTVFPNVEPTRKQRVFRKPG